MKRFIFIFSVSIFFFTFSGQAACACTCENFDGLRVDADGTTSKPTAGELEKWRREQNDYALFIGHVIKIEKVRIKQANERVLMKKVTVKVERFWLGIKFISPEMIIYTGVGGGDCGVPYVKGDQYFFWASRVNRFLETDICSPRIATDGLMSEMDSVFGNAKSVGYPRRE